MGTCFWKNYPWTWVWVPSCQPHIPDQSKSEYPPPRDFKWLIGISVFVSREAGDKLALWRTYHWSSIIMTMTMKAEATHAKKQKQKQKTIAVSKLYDVDTKTWSFGEIKNCAIIFFFGQNRINSYYYLRTLEKNKWPFQENVCTSGR